MSSKPSPEGVRRALELLNNRSTLIVEIQDLRERVKRLSVAEGELIAADQELWKLMANMDLKHPGNHGFEVRMTWFLSEFRDQLLAEAMRPVEEKTEEAKAS